MALPFVSCICPTYNRRKFLPNLIRIYKKQTYPQHLRELIILDDSEQTNEDLINELKGNENITYIYLKEKVPLGKKRNMINELAKGEYIICFDDDDYYPNNRIAHAVKEMKRTKKTLAGSTIIYTYYTHLKKIYVFGPYGENHATNGTMAYHKSFLENHKYDDEANFAEEKKYLDNFTFPLVQLKPESTILCIAHDSNTFDKKKVMQYGKETKLKLKDFVKDDVLRKYYEEL